MSLDLGQPLLWTPGRYFPGSILHMTALMIQSPNKHNIVAKFTWKWKKKMERNEYNLAYKGNHLSDSDNELFVDI